MTEASKNRVELKSTKDEDQKLSPTLSAGQLFSVGDTFFVNCFNRNAFHDCSTRGEDAVRLNLGGGRGGREGVAWLPTESAVLGLIPSKD